jgi:hypothetical protein
MVQQVEHPEGARISPEDVAPHLSAWIDPDGKVYHVPECAHYRVATRTFGVEPDVLERRGWMHLTYGAIFLDAREATQGQLDAIFVIHMVVAPRAKEPHAKKWAATVQRYIGAE